MGKWAQYRKRGSSSGTAAPLGPPPTPTFTNEAGTLYVRATGADDTGGSYEAEISSDGGATWAPESNFPWSAAHLFGDSGDYAGSWLRARENGNLITYLGTSPWSIALVV